MTAPDSHHHTDEGRQHHHVQEERVERDRREHLDAIDTPSAIVGMLAAFGLLALISGLFAAGAASLPLQIDLVDVDGSLTDTDIVGIVTALVVIFVAFLVGGWAAGRMAGRAGGPNGAATAFWFLLLMTLLAAAGAFLGQEYNAFAQMEVPDWISQLDADEVTRVAVVSALVGLLAMFLGGYIGGRLASPEDRAVINEPRVEARRAGSPRAIRSPRREGR